MATELSARLYLTAKAVCGFVAARFDVTYTPQAVDLDAAVLPPSVSDFVMRLVHVDWRGCR
ncbi:hypothetical protein [Rhodovastum atsumiense]|uniref:Uncharacterized protein n=1 Tax=Rhodovastum atsumiense TaxID=504468 RepID=A0A5M6IJ69_9PROT|nr:hypothetical protein [Rhodovastum atsumiense]KAA5608303.1 hypothetical protein F1189_29760 [Rhodovastum atsumiense]